MTEARRVLPYGPEAVIVECSTTAEVVGLAALARKRFADQVVDVVPGAATVTVVGRAPLTRALLDELASAAIDAEAVESGQLHTIEVVYDGVDLAWVADHLGLTPGALIEAHTGQVWTVAFCGFAPGFGYLAGETDSLRVPRLERPRSRVPAGSVALADRWSAVYPNASPGGWRLIGHTETILWRGDVVRPALLAPGDRVRFRAVG